MCTDAIVKIAIVQNDLCLCKIRRLEELKLCQPVPEHPQHFSHRPAKF